MRLALALGYPSVSALARSMTANDLTEWIAYYQLEPFGETRADIRIGQLSAMFANVHKNKNVQPFKPYDFVYNNEPKKEQSWEQQLQIMKMFSSKQQEKIKHGCK